MPLLFSYGTLQEPAVQQSTFGRHLQGTPDALARFAPESVPVQSPAPAEHQGRAEHRNALFTGQATNHVQGTAFEVTEGELARADEYERTAAYVRIAVRLASGRPAWVYVHGPSAPRMRLI